jgi:hypothetical protein
MFIQNKYHKWYFNIIKKRSTLNYQGYTEKHHIIPKSLGGSNDNANLVNLSAREHFICHLLLMKMTEGQAKYKMVHAANLLRRLNNHYIASSKLFDMIRRECSLARIGIPCGTETKDKIAKKLRGRKLTQEHISNRTIAQTGLKRSDEIKEKFKGPKSEKHKQNLSAALIGKHKSEDHKSKMREYKKTEDHKNKISMSKRGKIWIHLNEVGKVISKDDLSIYLAEGWITGMPKAECRD